MTAADLIYRAMRRAGIIRMAGRTPSPAEESDALVALNELISLWNTQRVLVPFVTRVTYQIPANTGEHTLGPSGTLSSQRPLDFVAAEVVVAGSQPAMRQPVEFVGLERWIAVPFKSEVSNFGPRVAYYDRGSPTATLYTAPLASQQTTMDAHVWASISTVSQPSEQIIAPDHYLTALEYNLAVSLAAMSRFNADPISPLVVQEAERLKLMLATYNSPEAVAQLASAGVAAQEGQKK